MRNRYTNFYPMILAALLAIVMAAACTPEAAKESSPLQLNFEHFGSYDLAGWEKISIPNDEDTGDVERTSAVYKKDGALISIDTLRSEYNYQIVYQLKDDAGKVLKERVLSFDNGTKELTELVSDYTLANAKMFVRTQAYGDKSWQQLGGIPTAATGAWKESEVEPLVDEALTAQEPERIDFEKEGSNALVWEQEMEPHTTKVFVFKAEKGQMLTLGFIDDTNQGSMDLGRYSIEPNTDEPFVMPIETTKDHRLSVTNNSDQKTSFRIFITLEDPDKSGK